MTSCWLKYLIIHSTVILSAAFAFITVSLMLERLICKLMLPYLNRVWQVTVIRQHLTGSGYTTMAVYYKPLMLLLNAAACQRVFSTFVTKNKVSSTWLDIHLYVTVLYGQRLACVDTCRRHASTHADDTCWHMPTTRVDTCRHMPMTHVDTCQWHMLTNVDTCRQHVSTHADTADWLSKYIAQLLVTADNKCIDWAENIGPFKKFIIPVCYDIKMHCVYWIVRLQTLKNGLVFGPPCK